MVKFGETRKEELRLSHCGDSTHPDDPDKYRGVTPLCDAVGERGKKISFTLFAASAGERVGQRSVAGVSSSQRSKPMFIWTETRLSSKNRSYRSLFDFVFSAPELE